MARKKRKKKKSSSSVMQRGEKYTPAELFAAALGAALLILFGVIIVTALLGN